MSTHEPSARVIARRAGSAQAVPKDLDALVTEHEALITHLTTTRSECWRKLSLGPNDALANRVRLCTADLALAWPERRRLRMLLALRNKEHEFFLDAQGRPKTHRIIQATS